ncbi:MAG: hypothetical protein WA418_38905 [Bradyrhizobium sp.]
MRPAFTLQAEVSRIKAPSFQCAMLRPAASQALKPDRARRDVKSCRDPRNGIYDVAARHGFRHRSRLSRDDDLHSAELPFETVRRPRMDGSARLRHNPRH